MKKITKKQKDIAGNLLHGITSKMPTISAEEVEKEKKRQAQALHQAMSAKENSDETIKELIDEIVSLKDGLSKREEEVANAKRVIEHLEEKVREETEQKDKLAQQKAELEQQKAKVESALQDEQKERSGMEVAMYVLNGEKDKETQRKVELEELLRVEKEKCQRLDLEVKKLTADFQHEKEAKGKQVAINQEMQQRLDNELDQRIQVERLLQDEVEKSKHLQAQAQDLAERLKAETALRESLQVAKDKETQQRVQLEGLLDTEKGLSANLRNLLDTEKGLNKSLRAQLEDTEMMIKHESDAKFAETTRRMQLEEQFAKEQERAFVSYPILHITLLTLT